MIEEVVSHKTDFNRRTGIIHRPVRCIPSMDVSQIEKAQLSPFQFEKLVAGQS